MTSGTSFSRSNKMVATMNASCHVEGSHGEFLPPACNPDGSQASRQKRARLQGTILKAKDEKRWLVRFDNGLEKECPSVTLKMLSDPGYNSMSPVTLASNAVSAAVLPSCDALALVALAQATLSAPAVSAPVLSSAPMAFNTSSSAPAASAPSLKVLRESFITWNTKHQLGSIRQPIFHHYKFIKKMQKSFSHFWNFSSCSGLEI
jgi:hypothetical protein